MKIKDLDISQNEKDILNEFDENDCADYLYFIDKEKQEEFLNNLADGLFSFKQKIIKKN